MKRPSFTRSWRGYEPADVDAFLDHLDAQVAAGHDPAPLVQAAVFGQARWGYDERQVDDWLDRVAARLGTQPPHSQPPAQPWAPSEAQTPAGQSWQASPTPPNPTADGTAAPLPSPITEPTPGLLARWFSRR